MTEDGKKKGAAAVLEAMENLIRERHMIPPGATVLCAVSGGADSICLLHALYRLRPKLGFSLAAAHYNHKLRGADSDQDAAFTAQFTALFCGEQRLSDGSRLPAVPLVVGSGDVAAEARRRGLGLEETAREMRYAFLRRTAADLGASRIATAHNAGDNAETILFHLARGSGLRGLTGIPPVRNELIRPLLSTTRQEIEAYLAYHGLPHREDRTNADDTYSRNRIRHQVIPVLEELFPGFTARMADTAARLRADEDYLTAQAQRIAHQAASAPQAQSIPAALVGDSPDPVAARTIRLLIGRLNGGDQDCSAAHLEAAVRLCRSTSPSAQLHLPRGLIARREYQQLVLTRVQSPPPLDSAPLALPGITAAGGWRITCTPEAYGGQRQGPWEFWLDRRLVPALTLRSRQTGDRLKLPGRPRKSIKKWYIDEKIPVHLRSALPVLDLDGQAAAAPGLGPAEELLPLPGADSWHITAAREKQFGKEEIPHAGEGYSGDFIQ